MSETTSPYAGAVPLVSVFVLVYLGIGGWRYLNARIANEKAESAARVKQIQEEPVKQIQEEPVTRRYDAPVTATVTLPVGVVRPGAAPESFVGKCPACAEVRVFRASKQIRYLKTTGWFTRCINERCTGSILDVFPVGSKQAQSLLDEGK